MNNKTMIIAVMLFMVLSNASGMNNVIIDSIVIKLAPWHIMPPADVTCFNFESDISYKEYHIFDNVVISDIIKELNSLKVSKGKSLDVRCKIYLYSHGEVFMSACIGPPRILSNGVLYHLPLSLKNKIDRITKKTTPIKSFEGTISPIERDVPFPNGRDSLYHFLLLKSEELYKVIKTPISLMVTCQIDAQGNTVKVIIKNRNDTTSNEIIKELTSLLSDILVNDVKWLPNKERFPFEVVSIPLKFRSRGDSPQD